MQLYHTFWFFYINSAPHMFGSRAENLGICDAVLLATSVAFY